MLWDFFRYNFLPIKGEAMTTSPGSRPNRGRRSIDPDALNRGDHNGNPPGIGFLALLKEDLRTNGGTIFEQGFWAIAVHRFGNWRMGFRFKLIPSAPDALSIALMYLFVEIAAGISLPYTVSLGTTGPDLAPQRDHPQRPVDRRRCPHPPEHDDSA